jgi:hypothetical protein
VKVDRGIGHVPPHKGPHPAHAGAPPAAAAAQEGGGGGSLGGVGLGGV